MLKPINIRYEPSKRQAMREIDLNIHYYMYYHPITLMINQHTRREGPVGWNATLEIFFI